MKLLLTGLLAITSCVNATTCDWPSVNNGFENLRTNPCEHTLNVHNVSQLTKVDEILFASAGVQAAPAIVNNVIYFGDTSGNVYARNANNLSQTYWTKNLGAGVDAPVTVSGNTLYVATGDIKLHALDIATGNELPGFPVVVDSNNLVGSDILAAPVVVDNIVIVPTCDGGSGNGPGFGTNVTPTNHQAINAFNATTGVKLWSTVVQPAPLGAQGGSFSTAAIDRNLHMMFIGTSNSDDQPTGKQTDALLALDYRTGHIKWSYQYTAGDAWGARYPSNPDADVGASPNLFNVKKKAAVGVHSKKGDYKAFERSTGKLLWQTNTVPNNYQFISFSAPGAAYDSTTGLIYVPVLIDNSNQPYQALTILSLNGNSGAGNIVNGINFGTCLCQITALDPDTGATVWVNTLPVVISGSLSAVNGVVYVTNWNGELRAFHGKTGAQLLLDNTTFSPFTFLSGATVVTNGKLYVTSGINGFPGGVTVFGLPSATNAPKKASKPVTARETQGKKPKVVKFTP